MLLNWFLRLFINVWLGLFLALQVIRFVGIMLRHDRSGPGCRTCWMRSVPTTVCISPDGDRGLAGIGRVSVVGTPQEKRMTVSRRAP